MPTSDRHTNPDFVPMFNNTNWEMPTGLWNIARPRLTPQPLQWSLLHLITVLFHLHQSCQPNAGSSHKIRSCKFKLLKKKGTA